MAKTEKAPEAQSGMEEYEEPPMRWNTGTMQFEPDLEPEPSGEASGLGWFWVLTALFLLLMLVLLVVAL